MPLEPNQPLADGVGALESDVEAIRKWAASKEFIHRIWIFGSRARSDFRPDSDLDIAVQHGPARGDANVLTTALVGPAEWKEELQSLVHHELDIQSYVAGETQKIEAGLQRSSRLIYDHKT